MAVQTRTCVAINTDQIVAGDLAKAIPEFSAVPPETKLSYAPSPGARRVFRIDELHRIAVKYKIPFEPKRTACFEWQLAPISRGDAASAMRQSLNAPDARIEVVSLSSPMGPKGTLVFPRSGITAGPSHVIWRGYVQYDKTRRFDIYARVKITVAMTRVVAAVDIPSGREIRAEDVRLETVEGFSTANDAATDLREAVGRSPLVAIHAGSTILRRNLAAPMQVMAGDTAQVRVKSGAAVLSFEARAEKSGHDGDIIPLRNPASGKIFRARVEGHGKVIVMPAPVDSRVN